MYDKKHDWIARAFVNPGKDRDSGEFATHLYYHFLTEPYCSDACFGRGYKKKGQSLILGINDMDVDEVVGLFEPYSKYIKESEVLWPRFDYTVTFKIDARHVHAKIAKIMTLPDLKTTSGDGIRRLEIVRTKKDDVGRNVSEVFFNFANITEETLYNIRSAIGSSLYDMYIIREDLLHHDYKFLNKPKQRGGKPTPKFDKSYVTYREGDQETRISLIGRDFDIIPPKLKSIKVLHPKSEEMKVHFREMNSLKDYHVDPSLSGIDDISDDINRRYKNKVEKAKKKKKTGRKRKK